MIANALTFLVGRLVFIYLLVTDGFHLFVVAFDLLEGLLDVLGPLKEGRDQFTIHFEFGLFHDWLIQID